MFCNKCGKQVDDAALICPYCGNPLRQAPAAPEAPEVAAPAAAAVDAMNNAGYINPAGGPATPGASGSVNANTGYYNPVGGGYPGAPGAYAPKPKKKGNKTLVLVGGIVAAVAVVALVLALTSKPYIKPIKKLFKAYNTNSAQLLQEAVSPDLFDSWYIENVTDHKNDDSFKVVSTRKLEGAELTEAISDYGVTKCYYVVVNDKIYVESDGTYNEYTETFVVGKLNGKWKVVDIF